MPDSEKVEKIDIGLLMALHAWQQQRASSHPDDGITVTLRFEGDLAPIEKAGFETHLVMGDEAMGVVRFKDISALTANPNVVWIGTGGRRRPYLDTAVKDIRARASDVAKVGPGGDGLWFHADGVSDTTFTSVANGTGKNVIVAVIDTGIDFTHPMFMKSLGPPRTTRILRIWDQGLDPADVSVCPDSKLLLPGVSGGPTYGIEYKESDINDALKGTAVIAHKDCEGHGTHVAGIAAGGPLFPASGDAKRIGVAPEADIIAVKLLDVPETIRFATVPKDEVEGQRRFRDAVLYCLRTAAALLPPKPVVINMSFGNSNEAGDGLDEDAHWIDQIMDPTKTAGPLNFPSGAVIVKACGNDADPSDRQVAHLTVPASGEVVVPLEVKDNRGGISTRWKNCGNNPHSPPLHVSFWYRRNFDKVKFALRLPTQTTFTADMGIAGNFDVGLILNSGLTPSLSFVPITDKVHRVTALHGTDAAVPHPSGGTVRRHEFSLVITPKVSGGTSTYLTGVYEVRIRAPSGTEVFIMGDENPFGSGSLSVTMAVAEKTADGNPLDPAVASALGPEFSIADTLGQHAITVAAYDDTDHKIAVFSSRGPLRDFSDPPGSKPLIGTKPELSAPGVKISSAESIDGDIGVGIKVPPFTDGVRFIEFSGTSMAAPMITGTIALMLGKDKTLNTTQVRTALTAAAAGRLGVDPAPPGDAYDRAYGSGMDDALKSHTP